MSWKISLPKSDSNRRSAGFKMRDGLPRIVALLKKIVSQKKNAWLRKTGLPKRNELLRKIGLPKRNA